MVMSLRGELEPLLTELGQLAESLFKYNISQLPVLSLEQTQQVTSIFNSDLSSLVTRFRKYYSLDESDLAQVADQFAISSDRWMSPVSFSAFSCIARAAKSVDDMRNYIYLGSWQGEGAKAFYSSFLVPFGGAALIHGQCAQEMAIAAKALADAVEVAKESIVWICKELIQFLGGGDGPGLPPGEVKPDGTSEAGFISILASVASLYLSVLGPEAAIGDVLLSATGLVSGMLSESKYPFTEQPIGLADSGVMPEVASVLVHNAWTALDGLDRNIAGFDEKIDQGLETDLDKYGPFSSLSARLQDPHLQSSAYAQLNFRGFGNPVKDANDAVVINIVNLYYAGYRILPEAAEEYGNAAAVCSAAHIGSMNHQFPRAVAKFNEAAQEFDKLLTTAVGELTESAAAIVKAATTYHTADEYGDEFTQIQAKIRDIPPPGSFAAQDQYTPPDWLGQPPPEWLSS